MRQSSPELAGVLTGPFERELVVNVFHGPDMALSDERFTSWSLQSGMGSAITAGGSGTLVHASVAGESLVPVGTEGDLSPFRAHIELVMWIRAGDVAEAVSLGRYRVVKVPAASDSTITIGGRDLVVTSSVQMSFLSLDETVRRRGFRFDEQSPAGATAYGEIRRITGMAVEETLPDVVLATPVTYEAKQGGRLAAVHKLAKALGGDAIVNSRGAWTVIPDTTGDPVVQLQLGEQGTVIDVAAEIDTDGVYNEVIGEFTTEAGETFHCVAAVTSGDLSVSGLYETTTRYYANEQVKTREQGDAAVQSVLALSLGAQQYDVQIQCNVNPLVEVGDVAELTGYTRPIVGQVRDVSLSDSPYMNLTLRVARNLT